jgi:hypothetical protein
MLHRLAGVLHADAPGVPGADTLARAGALAEGAGRLQADVLRTLGVDDERAARALLAAGKDALSHGRDAVTHLFRRHTDTDVDAGEPGPRLTALFSHGDAKLAPVGERPGAAQPRSASRLSYLDPNRALPALPSPAHTAPRSSTSQRSDTHPRSYLPHELPGADALGRAGMRSPGLPRALSDAGRTAGEHRRPTSWAGDGAQPAPRASRHRSAMATFGAGGGGDPPRWNGNFLHHVPEGVPEGEPEDEPEEKSDKRVRLRFRWLVLCGPD